MEDRISIAEAKFTDWPINGRYRVKLPEFLLIHGWTNWEPERFISMEQNLKKGDVLFDVGAEVGWVSAIYAQFVGAENMCLFESNPDNWQNIKATWEAENLPNPKSCRLALVSDRNTLAEPDFETGYDKDGWPLAALTGMVWTPRSYRYIHEHAHSTPQMSLDVFSAISGIVPKAITIDVEGAELRVLRGAIEILMSYRPLIWVSIHEDLLLRDYGGTPQQIDELMTSCNYLGEHLATDHEAHWLYRPQ